MPHATTAGYNVEPTDEEILARIDEEEKQDAEDAEVLTSLGTSSLLSETKQGQSGETPTTDLQSPAPDAESLSETDQSPALDQQATQESSSASSTDGSTPGTTSDQPSQQGSSEAGDDSASKSGRVRGKSTK